MKPPPRFLALADELHLEFDDRDLEQLGVYLAAIRVANEQFNLTRITDDEAMWVKHVLDSLTLLPYVEQAGATRIIDVGSGAGLPGVPLAICLPDVRVTLLEATGKKARFLQQAVADLHLQNVTVVNERAEVAAHDHERHRGQYDVAVARAVGKLPVLLELLAAFLREGGHILTIKGARAAAEIDEAKRALHLLHLAVVETRRTPTGTIVVVEKLRRTPKVYPRKPGEPKRVPL